MKDKLVRIGIVFMVVLFVVTSLGFGIYAFVAGTNDDSNNPNSQQADECILDLVQGTEVLAKPEAFKPATDVTQLEITDLEAGSGAEVKPSDCITAKYYGTLASDGKMFDENFTDAQAIKFALGEGNVIPGWDQGLVGMKVGGTRRLVIPSELAYGPQAQGEIPANSDLVFIVKVLSAE